MSAPTCRCDVCRCHTACGVAAVPGVPMSVAYCVVCLVMDVHPYAVLVANTACCGGLEHTHDAWRAMVTRTCAYLDISMAQFMTEVTEAVTLFLAEEDAP